MKPISLFQEWHQNELQLSTSPIPSACCLSTLGTDGYPNARFVALKEVKEEAFVITGPLLSRKGREIEAHPKVALTFWWAATERQIRIQGDAKRLEDVAADTYFRERNREACIVSWVSKQGEWLDDEHQLHQAFQEKEQTFAGQEIPRPDDWGGYSIDPVRIEFLEFKNTRFHERKLFVKRNGNWNLHFLQP